MNSDSHNRKKILYILFFVVLAISIPLTIFLAQQNQDIRQNASLSCTTPSPGDVIMIVDISGSTTDNRTSQKAAMKNFVTKVSQNNTVSGQFGIGLVSYAAKVKLNWSLQQGFDYTGLSNAIDTMPFLDNASAGEDDAIRIATDEFSKYGRQNIRKSVILLTDRLDSYAQDAVNDGLQVQPTSYYVLAYDISNSTIRRRLQELASSTGGTYHEYKKNTGPTEDQLLQEIAQEVSCPPITPVPTTNVTSSPIPTLSAAPSPTPTSIPTPTLTGTPTPTPTHGISITPLPSPTALPTNTPSPTPSPTQAVTPSVSTQPTISSNPSPTQELRAMEIDLTVFMHGIGHSGDNQNPTSFSLSNQNPLRKQRNLDIEIWTTGATRAKVLERSFTSTLVYDATEGNFKGVVYLGTYLPSGTYNVNIHSDQYLYNSFSGIHLNASTVNKLPVTTLVTGDIDNDDQLTILDYDILIGCYADTSPAISCPDEKIANSSLTYKDASDLTNDGKVDQFDYNLFLRDYAVQKSRRIVQ